MDIVKYQQYLEEVFAARRFSIKKLALSNYMNFQLKEIVQIDRSTWKIHALLLNENQHRNILWISHNVIWFHPRVWMRIDHCVKR